MNEPNAQPNAGWGQPGTPEHEARWEEFAERYAGTTDMLLAVLQKLTAMLSAEFLDAYYRVGEQMIDGDLTGEHGGSIAHIRLARTVANGLRATILAVEQCWKDMEKEGFDPSQHPIEGPIIVVLGDD